eukprot:11224424-Lingulodinium_polyedra.AAC.1
MEPSARSAHCLAVISALPGSGLEPVLGRLRSPCVASERSEGGRGMRRRSGGSGGATDAPEGGDGADDETGSP